MPYDVVSHFITACRYLRKGGKKKRLIRLIRPSPHGCETPVKPPSNRVIAGRRKRNGITVERCVMWEILQFYRDSIRVKSCVCLKKSFPFFPTPGLLYSNGKRKKKGIPAKRFEGVGSRSAFLPGGAKRGFSITGHAHRTFFFARRERERGRRGGEGRETKRNTTLPRARIALSRTSWIACKVYYREGKFSLPVSPLKDRASFEQLFLQKIKNDGK